MEALERKMIASIIDSIVVYSSDKIEIHFRFEDEISEMMEWVSGIEPDDTNDMMKEVSAV